MKQHLKFLYLMAHLDKEELSRFGKHLQLEYSGEGNALQVYQYYQRFFPGKERPKKMAIPYAYEQIYGSVMGTELNEPKKIWNAFSKLYGWLKDFLLMEKLRSDPYTADVLWMRVLSEKGMHPEYAKQATASYKTDYTAYFNKDACLQQIELGRHYKHHLTNDHPRPDFDAVQSVVLRKKESADFISLQLKCEWLTLNEVRPSKVPVLPETDGLPVLHLIYQDIFRMLTEGDEVYYTNIETLVNANKTRISPADINDIFRYMQYYAAQMLRKADEKTWALKLHELNKTLLVKATHYVHQEMSAIQFQNIVSAACLAADFEWVNKFVQDYAPFLPANIRAENVRISMVSIAFERKYFREVIALTQKPKFKDEIHKLRFKLFELRSMYELGLDCTDKLNTYQTYMLRRRKPFATYKESIIAFLAVFNMLLQKKASKKELLDAIESNHQIYFRNWLREKARNYRSTVYQRK